MNPQNDRDDPQPIDLAFHDEPGRSCDNALKTQGLSRALHAMTRARAARRRRRLAGLLVLAIGAGSLAWPWIPQRRASAPDPLSVLAQGDADRAAGEGDASGHAARGASEAVAPPGPSSEPSIAPSPARSTRPTVRVVQAGLAAARFAPQTRPRPTIVMLDDDTLLAVLDEARLPAILRRIEGPTPSVELRLLAADR
jgi:hypothetical protein